MIRPVYLIILDGFALGKRTTGDAIYQAVRQGRASFFENLFKRHPYSVLSSAGRAVGLPPKTMGNSEVNHLNMGAGRVVYQSIERINVAIRDDSFFQNKALLTAVENSKRHERPLHLGGILQGHSGTVHGDIKHLFGLLKMVKQHELKKVFFHPFTDGRDTNPFAAGEVYVPMFEAEVRKAGLQDVIAGGVVMGRELAMDRDTAWDKTLIAMRALVNAEGEFRAGSIAEAVAAAYARNNTDEFIRPTIIGNYPGMGPNDSFIFFNYRQDRAVQLTTAFRESDLRYFNYKKQGKLSEGVLLVVAFGGQIEGVKYQGTYREVVDIPGLTDRDIEGCITEDTYQEIVQLQSKVNNSVFVAMTEFYPGMNAMAAFPEGVIPQTIGEVISNAGLKQLRLAGPEKFAHVTGWFSGRRLEPFPGEDRHMAQDPTLKGRTQQGKSYDLVPEMTAYLEAQYALQMLAQDAYSSIIHNYQNLDMVGHTGNMEATISAVSHISACLQTTVPAFVKRGWGVIISADHGNADEMLLKKGDQMVDSTQHSRNPVPLWVLGADVRLRPRGIVPDTGSTVLDLMGLPRPAEMTAQSLIVR